MKFEKKDDLEYSKRLAIIRIGTIILLILISLFITNYILFQDSEKIYLENSSLNNEFEIVTINSRGDFNSIDYDIKVEGKVKIEITEDKNKLHILGFKITKGKGYEFYLSQNPNEKTGFLIGKTNANIGNFEFTIPENIENYNYINIYDTKREKIVAFSSLENIK